MTTINQSLAIPDCEDFMCRLSLELMFDGWMQYADRGTATIAGKAHRNGPYPWLWPSVLGVAPPGDGRMDPERVPRQAYRSTPVPPTGGNTLPTGPVGATLSTSPTPPSDDEADEPVKLPGSCRCCRCWPTIASPSAMPCPASASRNCGMACCTASRTCACAAKKCACATWSLTCRLICSGPSSFGCKCSSIWWSPRWLKRISCWPSSFCQGVEPTGACSVAVETVAGALTCVAACGAALVLKSPLSADDPAPLSACVGAAACVDASAAASNCDAKPCPLPEVPASVPAWLDAADE